MNTPPDTRARQTLQTVLLIVMSAVFAVLMYRVPWQVSPDPCILASAAAALTTVFLWLTRWQGSRGARLERNFLAVFLVGMPLVYVLRYLDSAARPAQLWLWIELLGLAGFAALAVLGVKRSPWFLVAGIAAHGLAWDLWHYHNSAYMPEWYPIFCMIVDLVLAAYVAARVPAYHAAYVDASRGSE